MKIDVPLCIHQSFPVFSGEAIRCFHGLRPVNAVEIEQDFYHENAVVPNWEKPAQLEWHHRAHPTAENWWQSVGIFQIPEELMQPIYALQKTTEQYKPATTIAALAKQRLCQSIYQFWIEQFKLSEENVDIMPVNAFSAGLQTVTVNYRIGAKEGMHFDTKDQPGLAMRNRSRIRFNVNLGPGLRWLLYTPVSLDGALRYLATNCNEQDDPTQPVWEAFASLGAPVFALRLAPGEGYFAPTDCIFHDASNYWSNQRHFVFQILAHPTTATIPGINKSLLAALSGSDEQPCITQIVENFR